MDLPTAIVILLVGAALVGWFTVARDGRVLEAFGSGFIGYRSYGWPQGVQEEDTVHFRFDEPRDPELREPDSPNPDGTPELIDLDGTAERVRLYRLS